MRRPRAARHHNQLGAAIGTAADAIGVTLAQNHGTVLYHGTVLCPSSRSERKLDEHKLSPASTALSPARMLRYSDLTFHFLISASIVPSIIICSMVLEMILE